MNLILEIKNKVIEINVDNFYLTDEEKEEISKKCLLNFI